MMREIKFRALVIKEELDNLGPNMNWAGVSQYEVIIDVVDISLDNGKVDYVTDGDGNEYSYASENLKSVIQYTGLKDKNGREIYERDDVKESFGDGYDVGKVVFKDGAFWVKFKADDQLLLGCDSEETEVIGNIYENPELLGDKKEEEQ